MKILKRLLVLVAAFYAPAYAQNCDCAANFQWVKNTFEKNDAGFQYILDQKGQQAYTAHNAAFEEKVKVVSGKNECARLIGEWLFFFRKGHIGFNVINTNTQNTSAEHRRTAESKIDIPSFKKYLATNKTNDLEGLWVSDAYSVALKYTGGKYYAFVTETSNADWDKALPKFFINDDRSGIYYMGDYSENPFDRAEVFEGVLLNLNGIYFKKTFPVVKTTDPDIDLFVAGIHSDMPSVKSLNDDTYLLRIPSFDLSYKDSIDKLIKTFEDKITKRKNLIIDLRGNGGGAEKCYSSLLPIIYTHPIRTVYWEYLSTPLNNQRWAEWLKTPDITEENRQFLSRVYQKLRANPGKFVNIYDHDGVALYRQASVAAYPENIAILIDEQNASTTEQFLLAAKQSRKVKLYGRKTFGALDLSELNEVSSPDHNFVLHYCLTKSLRLPDFPLDNYGIQPDYFLDKNIPPYKWVGWVMDRQKEQ